MSCPICLFEIKQKFDFKLCGHSVCLSCAYKLKECSFQSCVICRGKTWLKEVRRNGTIMLVDGGCQPISKKKIKTPVRYIMPITFPFEMEAQRREETLYTADTDSDSD